MGQTILDEYLANIEEDDDNNLPDPKPFGFSSIATMLSEAVEVMEQQAESNRELRRKLDKAEQLAATRNEDIGRLQGELRNMQARIAELEAAIDGCAGQWTPMPEGAHYCGCSEEDCPGEWRIENNGSRLVIGDGESELSIEFYEAIRVCWQIQPAT